MKLNKITVGYVIQVYDTETRQWVGQDFIGSGEVSVEATDSDVQYAEGDDEFELMSDRYLPFDMVQPPPVFGYGVSSPWPPYPGYYEWDKVEQ